jgi:hypothetical protein
MKCKPPAPVPASAKQAGDHVILSPEAFGRALGRSPWHAQLRQQWRGYCRGNRTRPCRQALWRAKSELQGRVAPRSMGVVMGRPIVDITGRRFARLLVLAPAGSGPDRYALRQRRHRERQPFARRKHTLLRLPAPISNSMVDEYVFERPPPGDMRMGAPFALEEFKEPVVSLARPEEWGHHGCSEAAHCGGRGA